jgi:predicted AlkP superfamily phosphohydrolase/phosphomutase
MVGEIIKGLGNIPMIILSDHGHGIRPTNLININEVLRQNGYLASREKAGKKPNPLLKASRIKQLLTSYVQRFGVGNLGLKLAQKFPLWKRLLASPLAIDWNRTRAYVTDLSALKSYSYGGIRINRELVPGAALEGVIQEILTLLGEIRDPRTSRQIVKFAGKREDLYRGPFIDRYPEIVLELEEGYGLGWEINGDLFDYGFMHSLQPGSHKKDSPVLYTLNLTTDVTRPLTLMDLAPTILACLGVVAEHVFDGKSFVRT